MLNLGQFVGEAVRPALLICGLLLYAPTSSAKEPPVPERDGNTSLAPIYSMASLGKAVTDTNPEIRAQRDQVRVLQARLAAAQRAFLPSVDATGLLQRRQIDVKNGGLGDAEFTAMEGGVTGRMRLYDGNRTANAVKIAKEELAAAKASLDAIIGDVLLDLLSSAANVRRDTKVKQFTEMQSDAINEQLRATSRRLSLGEATRTDQSLSRARLATSEAGIFAAEERLGVSGYHFTLVSGQSASAVPPLADLAPLPASLPEAQARAAVASLRLKQAQHAKSAGGYGVKFATGLLYPQMDAVAGYEYLSGGVANLFTGTLPDDRSALYGGVEVRVPIFQPRDHAEISRARAVRDQRISQLAFAERTVAEEVSVAWLRWRSAFDSIDAARIAERSIEQAAEGVQREFSGGNRTLVEVLDVQNEVLNARVAVARTERDEYVARANLLTVMGEMKPSTILTERYKTPGAQTPGAQAKLSSLRATGSALQRKR